MKSIFIVSLEICGENGERRRMDWVDKKIRSKYF